jgi:hypothetical protein
MFANEQHSQQKVKKNSFKCFEFVIKNMYSRVTSTKSPSFCMTTFSSSLTNLTALLFLSRDCSYYVSRQYWHLHRSEYRNTLIYTRTASRNLLSCDISLGWLNLRAHEAGDLVELIMLQYFMLCLIFTVTFIEVSSPVCCFTMYFGVYNRHFAAQLLFLDSLTFKMNAPRSFDMPDVLTQ